MVGAIVAWVRGAYEAPPKPRPSEKAAWVVVCVILFVLNCKVKDNRYFPLTKKNILTIMELYVTHDRNFILKQTNSVFR